MKIKKPCASGVPMLKPIVDEFNRFGEDKECAAALSTVDINHQFLSAVEKRDGHKAAGMMQTYHIPTNDMVPAMGLCIAARQGDTETVRLLLEKGVSANCCLMGKSPADWAESAGHDGVAKILRDAGSPRILQASVHIFTRRHF